MGAYALWRVNWIHPFADGNGRTARILSYVVLCAKYGFRLPGTKTIPEQIVADKIPYYEALEDADKNFEKGIIDVSAVERLLEGGLENQLEDALSNSDRSASAEASRALSEDELLITPSDVRRNEIMLTLKVEGDRHEKNFIEQNPVLWAGIFSLAATVLGVLLGSVLN